MEKEIDKKIKKSGRSIAYPSIALERAVELILKLRTELGKGPYSREDAAVGLGYRGISGSSVRTVAALSHYGLLIRTGNSTYSLSELADEITKPTDETGEKKRLSIIESAKTPNLFKKIIDKYQGQALPGLLENLLIREGVQDNSAKDAASLLKATLQFAGLLKNGVIVNPIEESSNNSIVGEDSNHKNINENDSSTIIHSGVKENSGTFTNNYSGRGWTIVIKTSDPISYDIKKKLLAISELLDGNELKDE